MKKKIFLALILVGQVGFLLAVLISAFSRFPLLRYLAAGLSVFFSFLLVCSRREKRYSLLWLLLVAGVPLLGSVAYLLYAEKGRDEESFRPNPHSFTGDGVYNLLNNATSSAVFSFDDVWYQKDGEKWFERFIRDVEQAKKSVFLEFYILAAGKVWDALFEKLLKNVKAGVHTEIVYDALGSAGRLPKQDLKKLKKAGAKVRAYRQSLFFFGKSINDRTHRKLALIDERVLYTGGLNLADEYLGRSETLGTFKDAGVRVEGDFRDAPLFIKTGVAPVRKNKGKEEGESPAVLGGLLLDESGKTPYAMEELLITLLFSCKRSATLTTPYLVPNDRLFDALTSAVRRGVSVTVFIPAVPDKKTVYESTLAFSERLIKCGVRVYRFNGFLHQKVSVFDESTAIVGSYNLDYRSFNLMKESAVLFTHENAVEDVQKDLAEIKRESELFLPVRVDRKTKVLRLLLRVAEPLL